MTSNPGSSAPALETIKAQQVVLALAVVGAAAIMIGSVSLIISLIGLGLIIVCTVLAAPAGRDRPGGGWWTMLAAGSALSAAGAVVSIGLESIGGLIAIIGAVLVVMGATIGFPLKPSA